MKCALSILCFCFHDLNSNRQLVSKSYITNAKVQSKHVLNTSEHWLHAIDFISKFKISNFSWHNTHLTLLQITSIIYEWWTWFNWKCLKIWQFILNFTPKYMHKHVNYDFDVSENDLEIVTIHPQLCCRCNVVFNNSLHWYQFNSSSTFLACISKNGNN